MKRVWFTPGLNIMWNGRVLPWIGLDEYGRHTLAFPVIVGSVVIALWECHCRPCALARESAASGDAA